MSPRALALLGLLGLGCGAGALPGAADYDLVGVTLRDPQTLVSTRSFHVRWSRALRELLGGPYTPIESAAAAIDPVRGRVFVGSSRGVLFSFDAEGRQVFRYDPESGVEAAPAVDPVWGDVFLATEDGMVHALRGRTGEARWKVSAGGPVRATPLVSDDAVFVVTENDQVVALSREDGTTLWSYQREADVEFAIAGHAGLARSEDGGTLYTGFTDGAVVALDAADGSLVWERQTILDDEGAEGGEAIRFFDADATPVVDGEVVYAASFRTGLYALERSSGTVRWREPLRGVVGIAVRGNLLVASSAEEGVVCLELDDRRIRWRREIERGAPSQALIHPSGVVLYSSSKGSMMMVDLRTGEEQGRLDAGRGFSAPPTVAGRYGWILSNGGQLFAFEI